MLSLGKLAALLLLFLPHAGASESVKQSPSADSTLSHDASCDRWIPARGPLKGVIVVSHGLNLKPEKMQEMAEEFANSGYEIFLPAFHGHCGKNNNYLHSDWGHWLGDSRFIFATARRVALKHNKPIFLIAYSFSALVFDALSNEMPFTKRIFFAPPLAMHFWYGPLLFFAKLFPDFTFDSRNLPEYRANQSSNFRSLLALDIYKEKWRKNPASSIPTLAWVDPKDELVSASGLAKLPTKNFHLMFLNNSKSTLPKTFHHLIISRESLGEVEWERVISESKRFLEE